MSFRALMNLRQSSNSICARCSLALRQNAPRQAPQRLFHSTPVSAVRLRRPRALASKIRKADAPPDPFFDSEPMEDGPPEEGAAKEPERTPEEQQELDRLAEGANIRWFEQDTSGKRTELESIQDWTKSMEEGGRVPQEVLDDPEKLTKALEQTVKDSEEDAFWESLDPQLEEEIFEDQDMDQIRDDLEAQFQKGLAEGKTLEQMREELREEVRVELRKQMAEAGIATPRYANVPPPAIIDKAWKASSRKQILRLNKTMQQAHKALFEGRPISQKLLLPMWKAYMASRQTIAQKWNAVPREVWDFLWKMFTIEDPLNNPNRLGHISRLAKDMSSAGVSLTSEQQILTIESQFIDNWEDDAIRNWKRCVPTLGAESSDCFTEFWELGLRMFSKVGDMDQAHRTVDKLLNAGGDPRVLISLVGGYAAKATEEDANEAWKAYQRLRNDLGSNMKLEDFDRVITHFLASNRIDDALRAFVDMMTSSKIKVQDNKPLPPHIGNKFFFGKWLKRLIGADELDGAHKVVDFMLRRHVEPAPIQLNGLIAAWFRTGAPQDLAKATSMGWSMVQRRLAFVQARQQGQRLPKPTDRSRPISYPAATLETFSVMAQTFRIRNMRSEMNKLYEAFGRAEIKSDAFIMNQLLQTLIQYGEYGRALDHYRTAVTEGGVTPDSHSFMALWKILLVNRVDIREEDQQQETGRARATFAEMMRFHPVFDGTLEPQLARKILHTFRRLQDPHGLVVALRALHEVFGFVPSDILALELAVGTTNLGFESAKQSARVRHRIAQQKKDMDNDIWRWRREMSARRTGDVPLDLDYDGLEPSREERGEELLEYLVRFFTPKRDADVAEFYDDDAMFEDAARQMGVYHDQKADTVESHAGERDMSVCTV